MRRQTIRQQPRTKQTLALEVRHLRAFVALVDQGTITEAAHSLGLAQSTVSESLAALERALGTAVTVRRRGSHAVSLTASGNALLPHARDVLESLDAAQVAVARVTNDAHGTIKIITNESISTYVLPNSLAKLRSRWPRTRFEVSVATCADARIRIDDGEFDLGLILEPMGSKGSTAAPITKSCTTLNTVVVGPDVPLIIFVQPSHPLVRTYSPEQVRRDKLSSYPIVMSDAAGDFYHLVRRFFESDDLPRPLFEVAGSVEGVKRAVATDSRALGILPAYTLAEELHNNRLTALSVRPKPPYMRLEARLSLRRPPHPAMGELVDDICGSLKGEHLDPPFR
jgi:DNA-binding transcriptional LysR family regulator